jgi:TctA family transporter
MDLFSDLIGNLSLGFGAVLTPTNLFYCFVGTLIGTLIGVLPGIGPSATLAMLLPLTFSLPPLASLVMLAGIYYGAQYGGSTTAILVNLPGEASSAVTTIDGYQMTRRGRAGPALAAAALGSFFAGTVATILIAVFAPPLSRMALSFTSAEYFALMVLGLVASVALASGSVVKSLAMIVAGLLFGLVGTDIYTGAPRFNLGLLELRSGIDFVPVAIGMFGISEILRNLENEATRTILVTKVTGLWLTKADWLRSIMPAIRGTALGSLLGVLPGGGGLLSSFAAYSLEKRISPNSAEFGKGAIEGVVAPESANNAGAQTAFIPMLTLGIPGNAVMALMIGALMIQGIAPGPNVARENPELFWGVIASMWIGNLMLVLLNLPLIGLWVKLLKVPYYALFPAIMAFCTIGVYSLENNPFALIFLTFFGFLGYLLIKLDCEPTPFILGFILGPMLEEHLRRAMILSRGDPTVLFTRPVSGSLLALAVICLILISVPHFSKKREEIFVED